MDYSYEIKELEGSEIEVTVSVQKEDFEKIKEKEYKKAAKNVKIPGFRPGKAPKNVIEPAIINTVIENTIKEIAPTVTSEILEKEEYTPFNQVDYDFEKVDLEKGFDFSFKCKVYPKFDMPDLKKINVKKEEVKVTKKELNEFLENYIKNVEEKKEEKDKLTLEKIDEEWVKEQKIPNVENVDQLKEFFENLLKRQKEQSVNEEYVKNVLDKVVEKTDFEVPQELIDRELEIKEHSNKHRIEELGLKWEDWLRQQEKSEEEIKKEWTEDIEKAIKLQLLIAKASKEAKQKVSEEEVDAFISQYYDPKTIQKFGMERLRQDAELNLMQNKVVNWIISEVESKDKK